MSLFKDYSSLFPIFLLPIFFLTLMFSNLYVDVMLVKLLSVIHSLCFFLSIIDPVQCLTA